MIRAKRGVFERADDVISFQAGENHQAFRLRGCAHLLPTKCPQRVEALHAPKGGIFVLTRSGSRAGQNAVMHNAAFPRLRRLFGKQRALALDAPAIA